MKRASDTDAPATKKKVRRRKFDVLMEKREATLAQRIVPASREAQYQERVLALTKRGQAIDGTHLADMAKALLEKDLAHPPRDSRTRIQIARAGLEAGGLIGPRSSEQHLHLHQTLPPVVQQMLESKMRELAALQQVPELPAAVTDVTPPEPIREKDLDVFGFQDGGR